MNHGYQEKTVRRIIRKKIDSWLESLPEEMRDEMKRNVICTGGAPASMLLGEEVKDFDLYFKTLASAEKLARHYVARFLKFHPDCKIIPEVRVTKSRVRIHIQSVGVAGEGGDDGYEYFETIPDENAANEFLDKAEKKKDEKPKDPDPYRPKFLSENAISLDGKVQIVIRFFGEIGVIHQNYDFEHCKCAYNRMTDTLHAPQTALLSLMSRTLYYTGSLYPLCSLFRMRKFVDRGWHISAGEILKMGFQVSELDLTNEWTLREQLIGVDMAYFSELLRIIEQDKNKAAAAAFDGKSDAGPRKLDATYLGELVDRIFNS